MDDLTLLIKDVAAPDSENDMSDEENPPMKSDLSNGYNSLRSDLSHSKKIQNQSMYESTSD